MSLTSMKRSTASVIGLLCPLAVQNGGTDNKDFMEGIGGAPSAASNMGSGAIAKPFSLKTENELDDIDEVDSSRVLRPERKGLGFDSGFHSSDDDSSLPTSPDSQLSMPEFPTEETELERETRELICSFYRIYTGLSRSERNRHKALETLKRVVDDVLTKHSITFKGMVNRLDLDQRDDMSFVQDVAEKTFGDGTTNWGRITSLVAFGAVLSEHLKRGGRPECVETVAEQISSYLANKKYDWLRDNNGWNGFIDFFHVEDPEAVVRNTLMAVVGFAGLGAGLALLTSGLEAWLIRPRSGLNQQDRVRRTPQHPPPCSNSMGDSFSPRQSSMCVKGHDSLTHTHHKVQLCSLVSGLSLGYE